MIFGCGEGRNTERETLHRLRQLERLENHFGMEKFKEGNEAVRECGESSVRSTDFEVT